MCECMVPTMYMKGCIDGLVETIFQMVGEGVIILTYIDRGSAALERKSYLNLI